MTVPTRDIYVTYLLSSAKVRIIFETTKFFYFNLDFYIFVNQILNINQEPSVLKNTDICVR